PVPRRPGHRGPGHRAAQPLHPVRRDVGRARGRGTPADRQAGGAPAPRAAGVRVPGPARTRHRPAAHRLLRHTRLADPARVPRVGRAGQVPVRTGCEDWPVTRVMFRQHAGLAIAGLVAFFGAVPLAVSRWYLTPILLVPLAVASWGWRSGTDADADGVAIRALFRQRRLPWERTRRFGPGKRRVTAMLDGGRSVQLPAVTPGDLAGLLQAGGQKLRKPAAQ